jgi:hypothetical protein
VTGKINEENAKKYSRRLYVVGAGRQTLRTVEVPNFSHFEEVYEKG